MEDARQRGWRLVRSGYEGGQDWIVVTRGGDEALERGLEGGQQGGRVIGGRGGDRARGGHGGGRGGSGEASHSASDSAGQILGQSSCCVLQLIGVNKEKYRVNFKMMKCLQINFSFYKPKHLPEYFHEC